MCTIVGNYDGDKQFTGFKVAEKIDGEYFSYWTHSAYKVGEVEVKNEDRNFEEYQDMTLLHPHEWRNVSYNPGMRGYTGLFCSIEHAKHYLQSFTSHTNTRLVILKMAIEEALKKGCLLICTSEEATLEANIVLGKRIVSLEEVDYNK